MRLAMSAVIAASLLSGQVAGAEHCATAVDRGAFDIAGLKSELMVVALACDMRDQYNTFVQHFRPDLQREERALNAWFARSYGRHARQQHDDYITTLANAQSQAGISEGTLFCKQHASMFGSVMAARSTTELVSFAAHQPIPQPKMLPSCTRRSSLTRTADNR